jgi:hypothetical protein
MNEHPSSAFGTFSPRGGEKALGAHWPRAPFSPLAGRRCRRRMRGLFVLSLFVALPLFADQKAVLRELTELLAVPNLADDTANIR